MTAAIETKGRAASKMGDNETPHSEPIVKEHNGLAVSPERTRAYGGRDGGGRAGQRARYGGHHGAAHDRRRKHDGLQGLLKMMECPSAREALVEWKLEVDGERILASAVRYKDCVEEPVGGTGRAPEGRHNLDTSVLAGLAGVAGEQGLVRCAVEHTSQAIGLLDSLKSIPAKLVTEHGSIPVKAGGAVSVSVRWEENGSGAKLAVDLPDGMRLVMAGRETMVLEVGDDAAVLSRVAGREGTLLAWRRRTGGDMDANDIQAWHARYAQDPRLLGLVAPPVRAIAGTPVLAGRVVMTGGDYGIGLGISLTFRYEQTHIGVRGADIEMLDNGMTLMRDRSSERRAFTQLARAGITVWPHPFSKREPFPGTWPVSWLADRDACWVAGRPAPATLSDWMSLAKKLEGLGIEITWDTTLPFKHCQPGAWTSLTEATHEPHDLNAWFAAGIGVRIDGEEVDMTKCLLGLIEDPEFPALAQAGEDCDAMWPIRVPGSDATPRWLAVSVARLRKLMAPLRDAGASVRREDGTMRVRMPIAAISETRAWADEVKCSADMATLMSKLEQARTANGPGMLTGATLRAYQEEGVAWLRFLDGMGWGGVLADDMGLGKTIQMLAYLAETCERSGPVLVVTPASVAGNWMCEAAKFTPGLRVGLAAGVARDDILARVNDFDIVITTYGNLTRSNEAFAAAGFRLAIFDEAQALKNAGSQIATAARTIRAQRVIALTGTPMENHIGELWALMDLVMPGLLGSRDTFRKRFQVPIERGDDGAMTRLKARLRPFMLRRLKTEVAKDLPLKTEVVLRLEMGDDQRELYEDLLVQQRALVAQARSTKGGNVSILALTGLLKLRQACCEPELLGQTCESIKRVTLLERLGGMIEEGRKVLVVSQFAEVIGLLDAALNEAHISHEVLTGDVPREQREAIVDRFQTGRADVFLLTLKAGGVGLNLTAADTVIHYDPWWNPAAESQATDRAYRIGQDKPVFVYKLLCANTVEDRVEQLQLKKAALSRNVLDGNDVDCKLSANDIAALFD